MWRTTKKKQGFVTERRYTMCVLKSIKHSIICGVQTLRVASRGEYQFQTAEVAKMHEEIFGTPSSLADDKRNLYGDRQRISHDIRTSFNKIVAGDVKAAD